MLVVSIVYLIIGLWAILHFKERFIIILPIFHVIADIFIGLYDKDVWFHTGFVRAIVIIIYILIYIRYIKPNKFNSLILIFLIYQLILILLFSSNIIVSFNFFLKIILYLMIFPIAYTYINDMHRLKLFMKSFYWSFIIVVINIIISNIFKLGESQYVADTFYEGTGGDAITYSIIYVILTPLLIKLFSNQKIYRITTQILFYFAAFSIMLSVRRAAIMVTALTILVQVFFLYSRKIFIIVLIGIILLAVTYPYYKVILIKRFDRRSEVLMRADIEGETRYKEVNYVLSALKDGSIRHILVGSELYNEINLDSEDLKNIGLGNRNFHTFFSNYLFGSGIIGFIMAYLIYIRFWKRAAQIRIKFFNNVKEFKLITMLFIVIWLFQLHSFGIWSITGNSIFYMYMGAILSIYDRNISKYMTKIEYNS